VGCLLSGTQRPLENEGPIPTSAFIIIFCRHDEIRDSLVLLTIFASCWSRLCKDESKERSKNHPRGQSTSSHVTLEAVRREIG
jgi:hypothetical protein